VISARYGWTDAEIRQIPYARLLQMVQVVSRRIAESEQRTWRQAAFVGWQFRCTQPIGKGKRYPTFKRYCRDMGLGDPRTDIDILTTKKKATEMMQRAQKAFADAHKIEHLALSPPTHLRPPRMPVKTNGR
jgi:hypothetical protein